MERKLPIRQKRRYSELKCHESPISGQLFPTAFTYPRFFDENLLDDDRKIKLFKDDPHTHETIFYFQLLKTIFECEEADYQKYLQKIYDIVENQEFDIIVPQSSHPLWTGMTSGRMKRAMVEFLEEMGEGEMGVEEGLKKYPIIGKVLILFLRSVLIIGEQCSSLDQEIGPSEVYQLLGNYFQLEITYYDNCVRFNQVDVFVYLQSPSQVYLAYIDPDCPEQLLDSSQLYQTDPGDEFNISSVKQMVSEIDIPVDTECFNTSKHNLEDTEEVEYDYSHSEMRMASRSQQDSDLKFSYLINDDSSLQNLNVIRSNKVLEKELIGEKKFLQFRLPSPVECYEIEQAPPQLQNAVSPILTPRQPKLVSFNQFDKENIYRSKKHSNLKDTIREEYQLLSTYETGFRKTTLTDFKETSDSQGFFKRQAMQVLGEQQPAKPTTLRSLYDMKSIKSICGSDSDSCFLDTPGMLSKLSSRANTINRWQQPPKPQPQPSPNTSTDFTSSFILKQMQQPYQSNIRSMKTRARTNRTNVKKLMLF